MNYTYTLHESPRLVSRNEGKIKAYESTEDLRSWSHDARRRTQYLQEWIKSDMPISVIPVQSVAALFNTMTCRSRRKVAPKCHPDCKSKLVLESIYNSCYAMQECMKKDSNLSSYFQEQEFETSYWPCERCLEVLKNIKMFWNIIVEKVFKVKIPKTEEFESSSHNCHHADTVHSVAKLWEKEIIEQAMFVNKIVPLLNRKSNFMKSGDSKNLCQVPKQSQTSEFVILHKSTPKSSHSCKNSAAQNKITRCTSVKIQMVDAEINTSNDEVNLYKHNVEYLQKKFNRQENEMAYLKRENNSLKLELENFYDNFSWKVQHCAPLKLTKASSIDSSTILPKPFESYADDETSKDNSSKGIDSEMIITMKNCKNENYKHVSLLQVLHKTNEPIDILDNIRKPSHTKENPIELLTKVRKTFGELVRREIDVVNKLKDTSKNSEITASFCRLSASKSEPSCSTLDFHSKVNTSSSESHFVSM